MDWISTPQELFLFEWVPGVSTPDGLVLLQNIQKRKSQQKISTMSILLEKKFLFPLVRSIDIERFHLKPSSIFVPFPYQRMSRDAMRIEQLREQSPRLMKFLLQHRAQFSQKTSYNKKIIGTKHSKEFYAIARVGQYTFGEFFVTFRKDTAWRVAVTSKQRMPWGGLKHPLFQSHAAYISQRPDGSYITESEAHYICGILNSNVVERYILQSSDNRSFKVRIPVQIPIFNSNDKRHKKISMLSQTAHREYANEERIVAIRKQLDQLYMSILGE